MNYFDLHSDTPYECYNQNQSFNKNSLAVSAECGKAFDNWSQTFAVWIRDELENPFENYRAILKDFKNKLMKKSDNLTPYFSVEGGAVLEKDLDRLYILKNDGISFLTLTWNGENAIAGGIKSDKGLTDFGKQVINEMNRLKIGCDLSHINEKSFYPALEISDFPLATHSNSKEICNNLRNLTDEQIKLIVEKGGIIGICFYPPFLGEDVFDGIYRNICRFLDLGCESNIAIGSDFDGGEMDKRLSGIDEIPQLYDYLYNRGINGPTLDKIFYNNANTYIKKLR